MAWMAVAEAAASLGVSERTIWRRIKSNAIESRGENGRTLVQLGAQDDAEGAHMPLSRVAFAQFSLRNGSDPSADMLAVLTDLRESFDEQIAATRRSVRFLAGIVCLLIVALGVGAWRHFDVQKKIAWDHRESIDALNEAHQGKLDELAANHQAELTSQAQNLAHAEGTASTRLEELVSLRDNAKLTEQLSAIEASRSKLESELTQHTKAFQETTASQLAALNAREKEVRSLREQVGVLKEDLQEAVFLGDARMTQSDKVTEYIRRSAARSIGYAEGVRQHLAYRAQKEQELQSQVARLRDTRQSPGKTIHDRESIWTSTINKDAANREDEAENEDDNGGKVSIQTILLDCFNAWFFGQEHMESLASASGRDGVSHP